MSGKIKILLTVLALGALVSVFYTFSLFHGPGTHTSRTASILDSAATDSCQRDTDKDGLSDCEETYWNTDFQNPDTDGDGFKDGEEVISGHDPAKKGPDDFLDKRGNVTEQAATLMLGGVAAGDLLPDSPKYQNSINAYSQAIVDRYQANSQVSDEDVAVSSDRSADVIKYGFAASNIMGPAFTELNTGLASVFGVIAEVPVDDLSKLNKTDPETYKKFIAAIDAQIGALDARIRAMRKLTVPPSMVVGQKNVVILLRGVQQQYRLLHQIAQDPVQGLFAMSSLTTLIRNTSIDVVEDFAMRLNNALHP